MKRKRLGYSLLPLLFASASAAADMKEAERVTAAAISVQACYGCHAKPGTDATGLVTFSSTDALDIANKLKAFHSGALSGTVMNRISRGYTPAELGQLAAVMANAYTPQIPSSQ